jgi:hypothetical protein
MRPKPIGLNDTSCPWVSRARKSLASTLDPKAEGSNPSRPIESPEKHPLPHRGLWRREANMGNGLVGERALRGKSIQAARVLEHVR